MREQSAGAAALEATSAPLAFSPAKAVLILSLLSNCTKAGWQLVCEDIERFAWAYIEYVRDSHLLQQLGT